MGHDELVDALEAKRRGASAPEAKAEGKQENPRARRQRACEETSSGRNAMTRQQLPPMDPSSDEADERQLALARAQGETYGEALMHMVQTVAEDGGEQAAGPYLVGYAVEEAEGMYEWTGDGLAWRDPGEENLHVEIAVRDAADGRFVPGLRVTVTLFDADGRELGTHEQPMLWHPMIYHYGRNWVCPATASTGCASTSTRHSFRATTGSTAAGSPNRSTSISPASKQRRARTEEVGRLAPPHARGAPSTRPVPGPEEKDDASSERAQRVH
jgi:hypothetical protein